jgi:hypothetical protein
MIHPPQFNIKLSTPQHLESPNTQFQACHLEWVSLGQTIDSHIEITLKYVAWEPMQPFAEPSTNPHATSQSQPICELECS